MFLYPLTLEIILKKKKGSKKQKKYNGDIYDYKAYLVFNWQKKVTPSGSALPMETSVPIVQNPDRGLIYEPPPPPPLLDPWGKGDMPIPARIKPTTKETKHTVDTPHIIGVEAIPIGVGVTIMETLGIHTIPSIPVGHPEHSGMMDWDTGEVAIRRVRLCVPIIDMPLSGMKVSMIHIMTLTPI